MLLPITLLTNVKKRANGTEYNRTKSKCKKCMNDIQIKYREENKIRLKERDSSYNAKVKNLRREQAKIRLSNPEKKKHRQDYIREYKKNRRIDDKTFVLNETLRKRVWRCVKNKKNHSIEYLGCDLNHYKKWIEFTMENDMTWENYGKKWNIDHVIPINKFDLENNDEAKKAFNWKNTCARYSSENFAKGDNINEEHNEKQIRLLKIFEQLLMDNPQPSSLGNEEKVQRLDKVS